jgi:hypothetical protein
MGAGSAGGNGVALGDGGGWVATVEEEMSGTCMEAERASTCGGVPCGFGNCNNATVCDLAAAAECATGLQDHPGQVLRAHTHEL